MSVDWNHLGGLIEIHLDQNAPSTFLVTGGLHNLNVSVLPFSGRLVPRYAVDIAENRAGEEGT